MGVGDSGGSGGETVVPVLYYGEPDGVPSDIHTPRAPPVGVDRRTGKPYDQTKLPKNDPAHADATSDGGYTFPNQRTGKYQQYVYTDGKATAFYWKHDNGTYVHRCAYEDGENDAQPDEPKDGGGYWGSSYDRINTHNEITYKYDPVNDRLRIRVWDKKREDGGKVYREVEIPGPKKRDDLPKPD
jgi:hypothetical protein